MAPCASTQVLHAVGVGDEQGEREQTERGASNGESLIRWMGETEGEARPPHLT